MVFPDGSHAVEPRRVVVEELSLIVFGAVADDPAEGFEPLAVGGGGGGGGAIAAAHDGVGAGGGEGAEGGGGEERVRGRGEGTIPETLQTRRSQAASREISARQAERSGEWSGGFPQWSRMKRVPGQASTRRRASPSSSGRMQRSKLRPRSP